MTLKDESHQKRKGPFLTTEALEKLELTPWPGTLAEQCKAMGLHASQVTHLRRLKLKMPDPQKLAREMRD